MRRHADVSSSLMSCATAARWERNGECEAFNRCFANLDSGTWSRFVAVCICVPCVDMITMFDPGELTTRDHLRHPSARRHAD
jgi:hypothetical protein